MENFAKSRNLDPLLSDSWYSIPDETFYKDKVNSPFSYFFSFKILWKHIENFATSTTRTQFPLTLSYKEEVI
jgi:hypothetical protein